MPILCFADFTQPFRLHTDANTIGLGALLYQVQDGKEWTISYASRTFSKSKAQYVSHNLEFLALKWAVARSFQEYLYGNIFSVYSDSNPLTYVLMTAKLDAMGHWWIAMFAQYNFAIHYKSERMNVEADAFS